MIIKHPRKLLTIILGGVGLLLLPSYIFYRSYPGNGLTAPALTLAAKTAATGLIYPTDMVFTPKGDMLVAEQSGKVRMVKNGVLTETPLLDISTLIKKNPGYDVRGLLGIELHPKFSINHKIYVFYSAPTADAGFDHQMIIAEYVLSTDNSTVDANSGRKILSVNIPGVGDNGGCLKFGADGYMYVALGDGGGPGDKHGPIGNAQNLDALLGKVLRIDVNVDSTYTIPASNPFVNKTGARPEIWAYGLRNPWRITFDRATGKMYTCDVGEGLWEEIDVIEKGGNYGWRMIEGNHCYNPQKDCDFTGTIKPIAEYDHTNGICIISGYVYNGKQLSSQKGKYFFADWAGPIYYIEKIQNEWQRGKITLQNYPDNLRIISFGEDKAGELYLITVADAGAGKPNGAIYKITKS